MLLGGPGIRDDGCRGCKIAWYHPVSLTQAAGRGEVLSNDQGVNLFFSRIDMKAVGSICFADHRPGGGGCSGEAEKRTRLEAAGCLTSRAGSVASHQTLHPQHQRFQPHKTPFCGGSLYPLTYPVFVANNHSLRTQEARRAITRCGSWV